MSIRKWIVVAAALTAAVLSSATPVLATTSPNPVHPNIVGGHEATEPYPAAAVLMINYKGDPNYELCTASLVSRMWVAINSHCVTDQTGQAAPASTFHLRIGSPDRTQGGELVGVSRVLVHAGWHWGAGAPAVQVDDIAMLLLDRYMSTLQPIEIAPHLAKPGAKTRLLGWGMTEPNPYDPELGGDVPVKLQELDTRLLPNSTSGCVDAFISAGEICVANPNGTDGPCLGDSGGPAMQKVGSNRWSLVGGASRFTGRICGRTPSVYTDMAFFRGWIYQVMTTGTVPADEPPAGSGGTQHDPAPIRTLTSGPLHWGRTLVNPGGR